MGISYLWTDGNDPAFADFYEKTEAYYSQLAGGRERREAFIPHNASESVTKVLLAYWDGQPVGCVGMRPYSPDAGEIKRLWVEPEHRWQGIATALMEQLEAQAVGLGYGKLLLQTRETMADAIRLYEKLGYRRRENYPPYDRLDGAVCYEKTLTVK